MLGRLLSELLLPTSHPLRLIRAVVSEVIHVEKSLNCCSIWSGSL